MKKQTARNSSKHIDGPYRVGRSTPGAGLGLFATETIKPGTFIIEYIGEKITSRQADERGTKYLFELNDRWAIDGAVRYNTARYINHACKPNAEVEIKRGKILISAIRTIHPGDEITYNYGPNYFDSFIKPYGCKCAACLDKKTKTKARTKRATKTNKRG